MLVFKLRTNGCVSVLQNFGLDENAARYAPMHGARGIDVAHRSAAIANACHAFMHKLSSMICNKTY